MPYIFKSFLITFIFSFCSLAFCNDSLEISGTITIQDTGNLFIILSNKETFKKNGEGLKIISKRISSLDSSLIYIDYSFANLDKNDYAIKCFIDKNGNNKIDVGMFGPKEPVGMSLVGKAPFGPPKFKHAKFFLDQSKTVNISVK